jgi:hypothetical protein
MLSMRHAEVRHTNENHQTIVQLDLCSSMELALRALKTAIARSGDERIEMGGLVDERLTSIYNLACAGKLAPPKPLLSSCQSGIP